MFYGKYFYCVVATGGSAVVANAYAALVDLKLNVAG